MPPQISTRGLDFSRGTYVSDGPELRSLDRLREGQIQIVESAAIEPGSETDRDISPDSQGNRSCAKTLLAVSPGFAADYKSATGGLAGTASIVGQSLSTSYSALAITGMGYSAKEDLRLPFSLERRATSKKAIIHESTTSGASRITIAEFDLSGDALQAVLMRSILVAEYSTDSVLATDWVFTAPTKRRATNFTVGQPARAPFERVWNGGAAGGDGTACDTVRYTLMDRESNLLSGASSSTAQLCWATTVVSVNALGNSNPVLSSVNVAGLSSPGPSEGFGTIDLTNGDSATKRVVSNATSKIVTIANDGTVTTTTGPITFRGLPIVGVAFSAARFNRTQDNYGSSIPILGKISISQD